MKILPQDQVTWLFKNYSNTKFNALEKQKKQNNAQAGSTELDEKFNSYIKKIYKNPKLEQTLK